jgi:hypothetical protein
MLSVIVRAMQYSLISSLTLTNNYLACQNAFLKRLLIYVLPYQKLILLFHKQRIRKGAQLTKFGACSEYKKLHSPQYYTNHRTTDAVSASDNFPSLKYSTDTEEKKT